MNLNQLLKRYEILYVDFEESQKSKLINQLRSLGFDLPEEIRSPIKIHSDRTVSFVTGFNEGMAYSSDTIFKKLKPNCKKIAYSKISDNEKESHWYKIRANK